jgi:hypothetical protein
LVNHRDLSKILRAQVDAVNNGFPGSLFWDKMTLPHGAIDCFVNTSKISTTGEITTFLDVFKGRNGDYDPVYFGVSYENTTWHRGRNPRVVDVNMIRTVREVFSVASLKGRKL